MLKWLLVVLVIAVVYFFFIKKKPLSNEQPSKKREKLDDDDMIECKSCGTYITLNEALLQNGEYYCSDECMRG